MPVDCQRSTAGGKGNLGMFFERSPKICAAGLPSQQPDNQIGDDLQHYLMKDEVDSLINDAILPAKTPRPLPPLRHPIPLDMRFSGVYGHVAGIINPPNKSKFQTLVDDFKETTYSSYWKKPLGKVQDPLPMLPEGLDVYKTTFGRKLPEAERLYDVVFPKVPLEDKTPASRFPAAQTDRNYCKPPFSEDLTYGHRTHVDKRGLYAKACVTEDNIVIGNGNRTVLNTTQTSFQEFNKARLGKVLAPNNNINNVPEGYSFGILKKPDNLKQCLSFCEINPECDFTRKCLAHLNTVRKCMSTRFLPSFFNDFYLKLKYYDTEKRGWLPRDVLYKYCASKFIRFDPSLIEPLLSKWEAFDGENIDYKFFAHMINYREPIEYIPHVPDLPPDCIDFRTTYSDMVRPGQERDESRMAGIPSGRYFDLPYPVTPNFCCKAVRTCLPQESDAMSCLTPSILTLMHVNHRDMYAKREPDVVKKVFKAAGEDFSDEKFNDIWEEAKKYHYQGWVCFETFRQALRKVSETEKTTS
ncbi:PREDICTED: EF-hand domain-containing family member B [Papilio polytes]|uniref:EF-hand domain-containing family member B n=1 Tax=Papilio polytes TaxID=76194 RepID=UPI000675E10D|nr:PREDICTED: EF-hand domain-containing family member B [Papilio polytes]